MKTKPRATRRSPARTGSAVCMKCGGIHRRMPLDHLAEYMCSLPVLGTEIHGKRKILPCGGSLEPKRQSPPTPPSATECGQ